MVWVAETSLWSLLAPVTVIWCLPYRLVFFCGSFPPVLDFGLGFPASDASHWMCAMSSPDLEEALSRSEEFAAQLIESSLGCFKLPRCYRSEARSITKRNRTSPLRTRS